MFSYGLDLNVGAQNLGFLRISAESPYVPRQAHVFVDHDLSATDYFPLRVASHGDEYKVKDFSCLDQFFAMFFAQADPSGVVARHRNQFARAGALAFSHGLSLCDDFAQHAGQCECHPTLVMDR